MEEEAVSRNLPDHIVERILAMIPFPHLFKVRALSKAWRTRFSPIQSQDQEDKKPAATSCLSQVLCKPWRTRCSPNQSRDHIEKKPGATSCLALVLCKPWRTRSSSITAQDFEETKLLATSFQREVRERSSTWKTFSGPIFFPTEIARVLGKKDLIVYDHASDQWLRMPLSFLPQNILTLPQVIPDGGRFLDARLVTRTCFLDGALLFLYGGRDEAKGLDKLYIVNILTRSWKQLPPPPRTEYPHVDGKIVSDTSSETYKLVLFYNAGNPFAQIYDSRSGTWSIQWYDRFGTRRLCTSGTSGNQAYLNGVFYTWLIYDDETTPDTNMCFTHILAFHVKEEAFRELKMPPKDQEHVLSRRPLDLVACNANLFAVGSCRGRDQYVTSVIVAKVDLESRSCIEVARGPPADLDFGDFHDFSRPTSHRNCIIWQGVSEKKLLAYSLDRDEWKAIRVPFTPSSLEHDGTLVSRVREYSWINSSFEPGLNPFVAV